MHVPAPASGPASVPSPAGPPGSAGPASPPGSAGPASSPGPLPQAPAARDAAQPGTKIVLSAEEIRRALTRIAHEILERTDGAADVILLGIPTRGVHLARRLAGRLAQVEGLAAPAGSLDI